MLEAKYDSRDSRQWVVIDICNWLILVKNIFAHHSVFMQTLTFDLQLHIHVVMQFAGLVS